MIPTITEGFRYDAAQTNLSIKTIGATQRGKLWCVIVTCSASNTAHVSLRIGFGATTLPTVTVNSETGAVGICVSHPGLAIGGGMVFTNGGQPLGVGAAGEDILLTNSAPTGGFFDIVLTFWIDELAE